jgi:hypothetical protein
VQCSIRVLRTPLPFSGHREEATRIANNLELRNEKNPSAEANIALIYVGLGDKDQAMMWLNKAYHARFIHPFWCCLPLIRYGPILDSKTCCAASVYQTKHTRCPCSGIL